jgi:hypothetical protein
VECKLLELKEFESKATPGKKTGVLSILEGLKFWAREDAINEDRSLLDPNVSSLSSALQRFQFPSAKLFFVCFQDWLAIHPRVRFEDESGHS